MFYNNFSQSEQCNSLTKDVVSEVMEHASFDCMDIVLADFGEIQEDCLIHKIRPAIVISSSRYNMNSPVMQVVPMSKKFKNMDAHYHIYVDRDDCEGLNNAGVAMVEQMTTIDRAHVLHYIGCVVDDRLIDKIHQGIIDQLGLEGC